MDIRINPNSHIPLFEQLVQQVESLIMSGRLALGEKLPSVRQLAEKLLVNPNTVARAYRELERRGLTASRHGAGVFVVDQASPFRQQERQRMLESRVDELLDQAEVLRISEAELLATVKRRWAARDGEDREEQGTYEADH